MEAFEALRQIPRVLWDGLSVVVAGAVFFVLTAIWAHTDPPIFFELLIVLVFAFFIGGIHGTIVKTVETGRGRIGDFASSAVSNYPALTAGFVLLNAIHYSTLWAGREILLISRDNVDILTSNFGVSLVLLFTAVFASLIFVTAAAIFFVFQFFGVVVVADEHDGVVEGVLGGLEGSHAFVRGNLGSVVEYVFVSVLLYLLSVALFGFLPRLVLRRISSEPATEGGVPSMMFAFSVAVFLVVFYTYQTVYYCSLSSE